MSEPRDVDFRRVLQFAAGVLLLILFAMGVMHVLLGFLERMQRVSRPAAHALIDAEAPREPPAPRLQEHPIADLKALRDRENAQLNGYGWIDQGKGRVHIPIERAMELMAKEATP